MIDLDIFKPTTITVNDNNYLSFKEWAVSNEHIKGTWHLIAKADNLSVDDIKSGRIIDAGFVFVEGKK